MQNENPDDGMPSNDENLEEKVNTTTTIQEGQKQTIVTYRKRKIFSAVFLTAAVTVASYFLLTNRPQPTQKTDIGYNSKPAVERNEETKRKNRTGSYSQASKLNPQDFWQKLKPGERYNLISEEFRRLQRKKEEKPSQACIESIVSYLANNGYSQQVWHNTPTLERYRLIGEEFKRLKSEGGALKTQEVDLMISYLVKQGYLWEVWQRIPDEEKYNLMSDVFKKLPFKKRWELTRGTIEEELRRRGNQIKKDLYAMLDDLRSIVYSGKPLAEEKREEPISRIKLERAYGLLKEYFTRAKERGKENGAR